MKALISYVNVHLYLFHPGGTYNITAIVHARHLGRYNTPLAFLFTKYSDPDRTVHIVMYLNGHCRIQKIEEEIKSEGPYKHPKRASKVPPPKSVEEGFPLPPPE